MHRPWLLLSLLLAPSLALAAVELEVATAVSEERARVTLRWAEPLTVELETDPREALLRFDGPVDSEALEGLEERLPDWVAWVSRAYDSILIRAARPVDWSVTRSGGRLTLAMERRAESAAGPAPSVPVAEDGSRARLWRLEATLAAEVGELRLARQRQEALVTEHPRTPGFIGDRALTESRLGLWRPAAASYQRAMAFGGDPAGHAGDRARLLYQHGPRLRLSLERQRVRRADRQWVTRLSGRDTLGPRATWGMTVAGRQVTAPEVLRADGRTTRVDTARGRVAVWAEGEAGRAGYLRGTLAHAAGRSGGGLRYRHRLDQTRLEAEVSLDRPLWDYVGGIVDGGRYDAVEVAAETWREGRWQLGGRTGPRRYHLDDREDLAESWRVNLFGRYWLEQRPELSVGYNLDWESVHARRDPAGPAGTYRPLGINDQRVHSVDVSAADQLADYLRYEVGVGVSLDRPNQAYGPFLQGALRYHPLPRLETGLTFLRADGTYRGEPAVLSRVGLYAMVHPWP